MLYAEALPVLRIDERTTIGAFLDVISDEAVSGLSGLRASPTIGVDPFAPMTGTLQDLLSPVTMRWGEELGVCLFG